MDGDRCLGVEGLSVPTSLPTGTAVSFGVTWEILGSETPLTLIDTRPRFHHGYERVTRKEIRDVTREEYSISKGLLNYSYILITGFRENLGR